MSALPSSTRFASRSQTAMMLVWSYFQMPGRSWTREMRPTPMAPMLMRLLGESCPKTLDGTMVGKPAAAAAPSDVFRNVLRDDMMVFVLSFMLCLSFPQLTCERNDLCVLLCLDDKLRRKQALRLVLRDVRPVGDLRLGDLGFGRAGVVEELVHLV